MKKAILEHNVTGDRKLVAPADVWRHKSSGWVRVGTTDGEPQAAAPAPKPEPGNGLPDDATVEAKELFAELQSWLPLAPTEKRHRDIIILEEALEGAGYPVENPTMPLDKKGVKEARKAFDDAKKED